MFRFFKNLNTSRTRHVFFFLKKDNLTINYKKCFDSKSSKACKVFICCQTQSGRREQHTKNGGAPWLPEPSMENNDKHSAAQTAQSHRKSARKQHKTPQFLHKHRSDHKIHPLAVEIKRINPKKRQGEQPDEAP